MTSPAVMWALTAQTYGFRSLSDRHAAGYAVGGRARAWAHGAVEVRLDTTSCNSYTCRSHQGLQDHHAGSPPGTRSRPQIAKSDLLTSFEAGLDGVPQIGVLDFEPGRYVGLLRSRAASWVGDTFAGWGKVRTRKCILPQAANHRVRVTLVPWPGSTASTRTPRFSSCMGRTVPMRAEHTSQS